MIFTLLLVFASDSINLQDYGYQGSKVPTFLQDKPTKEWFYSFIPIESDSPENFNHSLSFSKVEIERSSGIEIQNPWDFQLDLAISTEFVKNGKPSFRNYVIRLEPFESVKVDMAQFSESLRVKYVSLTGFQAKLQLRDGTSREFDVITLQNKVSTSQDCWNTDYCLGNRTCTSCYCTKYFNVRSELTGGDVVALFMKVYRSRNYGSCSTQDKNYVLNVYWPTYAATPFHIGGVGLSFRGESYCGERCQVASYPTHQAETGREWNWRYYNDLFLLNFFDTVLHFPYNTGMAICPSPSTQANCASYNHERFKVYTRDF